MTSEHKKHLLELKKIYEGSLADHKRQEDTAKKRLDEVLNDLKIALNDVKKAKDEQDTLKAENVRLQADSKRIEGEKRAFYDLKAREEEGFKAHTEVLAKDAEDIEVKAKRENIKLTAREDQLRQLKIDAEYTLSKNEGVLANINQRLAQVEAITKNNEVAALDLKEKQFQHQEEVKKFNLEKSTHTAELSKIALDKEEIKKRELVISGKDTSISVREKNALAKEEAQKDKDIEQDFKQGELDKQERRINNLIEIHKLK